MIKEVEDIDTPQVLHPQQMPHTPPIQATAPSPTTEREYPAPLSSPVHRSDINTSADTSEIDWSTQAQRPDEYVLPSQASPLPFHSHLPSTPSPNPHQACQHAQTPLSTAQRFGQFHHQILALAAHHVQGRTAHFGVQQLKQPGLERIRRLMM